MKDSVAVHVVNCLEHLVHVVLDPLLGQVVTTSLYRFVHVHVHQLEYERESARRFVAAHQHSKLVCFFASCSKQLQMKVDLLKHLVQRDDVGVRRKSLQGLDLAQVVNLSKQWAKASEQAKLRCCSTN